MIAFKKNTPTLTLDQREAEREAVSMLSRAQRLLLQDDSNVNEAQKLRDQVVCDLLPSKRMYIKGKHPQSLLVDVDRRLLRARMKLSQSGKLHPSGEFGRKKKKSSYSDEQKRKIQSRYSNVRAAQEWKNMIALTWFALAATAVLGLMVAYQQIYGFSDLYTSFQWVPPR